MWKMVLFSVLNYKGSFLFGAEEEGPQDRGEGDTKISLVRDYRYFWLLGVPPC